MDPKDANRCKVLLDALKKVENHTARQENLKIDLGIGGALAGILLLMLAGLAIQQRLRARRGLFTEGPMATLSHLFVFVFLIAFPALLLRNRLRDRHWNRALSFQRRCEREPGFCTEECRKLKMRIDGARSGTVTFSLATLAFGLVFVFVALAFFSAFFRRVDRPLRFPLFAPASPPPDPVAPPAPAAAASTRTFKLRRVEKDDVPHAPADDPVCAICLAALWDRPVCQLPCTHRFHAHCAEDWLRKAPRPLCPLCKAEVAADPDVAADADAAA